MKSNKSDIFRILLQGFTYLVGGRRGMLQLMTDMTGYINFSENFTSRQLKEKPREFPGN